MPQDYRDQRDPASPRNGESGEPSGMAGLLHRRFHEAKKAYIDAAMGKAETWARSIGDGTSGVKLTDIPKFLKALGLKLVDERKCVVDREVYEAYKTLARQALNTPTQADWMKDE